jgi:hypothetical protein
MRIPLFRECHKKKIHKFKPSTKSINPHTIRLFNKPPDELIDEYVSDVSDMTQEDKILNEIRIVLPNPIGEINFESNIKNIFRKHGLYCTPGLQTKLILKYFNIWKNEYENTVLANEQSHLFEIAKKKF